MTSTPQNLALPTPRVPDPAVVPALRWGVVGTGIADKFVRAIHTHTTQRAVAVTARDQDRTTAFAATHGIDRVVGSVAELLGAPDVDVVYVATPHPLHRELALEAIAAGKHVLIEKPVAMSADEARDITDAGRAAGVLVMEAMWTRYLPQADVLRRLLADGVLGDVRLVTADFGFVAPHDPDSRLWNPALGGGALLDAGVYPISFASSVLGAPSTVVASGATGPGGVDTRANLLLTTSAGAGALLSTAIDTVLPSLASVHGTTGRVELAPPMFGPTSITLTLGQFDDTRSATWTDDRFERIHDGLSDQAVHFASYVAQGLTESPLHPHHEVVSVMATIDEARRQVSAAGTV